MKAVLLPLLFIPGCFTVTYAQTQPVPQALPYIQRFNDLLPADTTYPAGWQGWALSGTPGSSFNMAAPAGNKPLLTGSASSTINGIYNYSGKIGFLNSSSADNGLVLALNTSGQYGVPLQYDVVTVRNPYDSGSNTRINEIVLQYRPGGSGSFTNIPGTLYSNNTLTQTGTGVTAAQHPLTFRIILPEACDNQAVVQLRWVSRQVSGNGSRPSFAIDNIQADSGTGARQPDFDFNGCAPGAGPGNGFTQYSVSGAQVWSCSSFGRNGSNGVQINGFSNGAVENEDWLISPAVNLDSFDYPLLRFASRAAFAGPPLQLKISVDYDGKSDPRSATWASLDGRFPEIYRDAWQVSDSINLAAFKQPGVHIAFVYTSSPARGAARWTLDDLQISNSPLPPAPSITCNQALLDFDYLAAGQTSAARPLQFRANDFNSGLALAAPAGFRIAADSSGPYGHLLNYSKDELAAGPHTVWVQFQPGSPGQSFSGALAFEAGSSRLQPVQLAGTSLRSLKVVNWNIAWFGSPAQKPANDDLQQANVSTILRQLNADIFALAEVVDTARLRSVVGQLPGYSYVLSDFGSYADNAADPDYKGAQKLAFVYRTDVIRPLRAYGVLRQGGGDSAYYNWSSGRFPYLLEAQARLNNDSARIHFVLLHAKANTGDNAGEKIAAYHRRRNGARQLKDTLDLQYAYSNLLVTGDFNDALNKTVTTELAPDTTTSYIDFVNDSLDYRPITLPLSLAGAQSTISYNTVIDNVLASNEMGIAYLPGSARVVTEVERMVSSYGATTTDHYPVQSRYDLGVLAHPIPLDGLGAVKDGAGIKLHWQTAYEINAAYYIVERSRNQRDFEPLDTVSAHGSTGQPCHYQAYDGQPRPGRWYYRLKAVSLDGSYRYSALQPVLITGKDFLLQLLWRIFGNQLQVWLSTDKGGPALLQLVDLQGRVCYQGHPALVAGRNTITLDTSDLPAGIYFLRVQSGGHSQVSRIFIGH